MKRLLVGSYEEARVFARKSFDRLTPTQKLEWLSQMAAFLDAANPTLRARRFGFPLPQKRRR